MSGIQFLAQADCFLQILLQPNSATHPVSCSKTTLGSYPNSKFSVSHTIEGENLWSLNVMPLQRQFTFYPRNQYDCINNAGLTYKNTTHQNIIMHYLECIFLNCTDVMPLTLPLTFRCLSKFHFPLTWWWKIDPLMSPCTVHLMSPCTVHLMSPCTTHLSFYLLLKNCWNWINCRLGCNISHVSLPAHNHQTWIQIITLQTVPHKSEKSAN